MSHAAALAVTNSGCDTGAPTCLPEREARVDESCSAARCQSNGTLAGQSASPANRFRDVTGSIDYIW